ncbi:hypothetical protein FO519_007196 [Halicephalobus sp. NKZ332]|nr:hypothetical protein FO519_007196 [Halicephalobus sp. NKZ332]
MVLQWILGIQQQNPEEIIQKLETTRTERELALREAIIERKNAYKVAESKERLNWIAPTGVLTVALSAVAAYHHKNIFYSLPIIPILSFIGHEAHLAYGNKLSAILDVTEKVLADADTRLSTRPISVKEVEARVEQQKMSCIMSCVDLTD